MIGLWYVNYPMYSVVSNGVRNLAGVFLQAYAGTTRHSNEYGSAAIYLRLVLITVTHVKYYGYNGERIFQIGLYLPQVS